MDFEKSALTFAELNHFNNFLLLQMKLMHDGKIQPIYRGDNLKALRAKLGLSSFQDDSDLSMLLERLFMVGEKARLFYSSEFFGLSKNNIIKIDDCDENVFNFIFDQIRNSTKNKNLPTKTFFDKNPFFRDYFFGKENKKFYSQIMMSFPPSQRMPLRNYYLTLLHQLGAINYRDKSLLLSTTIEQDAADQFTSSFEKNTIIPFSLSAASTSQNKSIKLHCWQPVEHGKRNLKKIGLPQYKGVPYSNQKEVSLLAGILPHYITGLEIVEDAKFYINPSLFNGSINESLFLDGFNIDQTNFDKVLHQTNYESGYETDGNNTWEK